MKLLTIYFPGGGAVRKNGGAKYSLKMSTLLKYHAMQYTRMSHVHCSGMLSPETVTFASGDTVTVGGAGGRAVE